MIQSLDDNSLRIRGEAADALGNIGGEKVIEPLARVLEKDDCFAVRERVVDALGRIGSEKVVEILIENKTVDISEKEKLPIADNKDNHTYISIGIILSIIAIVISTYVIIRNRELYRKW